VWVPAIALRTQLITRDGRMLRVS